MLVKLLFQAACASLFLQSGQGRVYPGRKKPANFAVERRRMGPHVCFSGFGSGCCPGWMLSPGSGQCTLPLCAFGCGSGLCIAPNLCSCLDGEQGITCPEPPGTCGEYGCDLSCNHGGCQEVARVCPLGFSMVETANGVRCTDINECLSAACEGLCVNTKGGFVCECGRGMQLSADRHSCQDTDECLATPCQHHCKNSIGSYHCSCRPGYHLHGNRHSCVDVNECWQPGARRACQHACHNTPGSYLCSCRPGYRLSGDRVSCEGFPKSVLVPSPILQSLQHPPTLLLLPPGPERPLLIPRGSPSPLLPAPAPGTQAPFSPAALTSPDAILSLHTEGAPGTLVPSPALPAPYCWHRGAPQKHGTHWMESGCLSCACQGGQVLCEPVSCQVVCSHPLPAPDGGCCPSCAGCLHDGVARAEGDIFSLPDRNCTVCVCLAGNVSCISPECPPGPCPTASMADCCFCQPAKCNFRGRTYVHGAQFSLDGDDCTTCVCQSGEVECSFAPCPALDCPQHEWHLGPGQCCFACLDPPSPSGCFVDDNGVEFPVGQIWSPGDPYCNYEGRKVMNGQTFSPEGDPCTYCTCQLGEVTCEKRLCPQSCAEPTMLPAACCPPCQADAEVLLKSSDPSPSPKDSPASTLHPSVTPSPGSPRRLAQLLLRTSLPLLDNRPPSAAADSPFLGTKVPGESPTTGLSPLECPRGPLAALLPTAVPGPAGFLGTMAPEGSPSLSPKAQGSPEDVDHSPVPPSSKEQPRVLETP
ncbi:von Willebrand factor C and EGF domain-containing protein isoform X2 [Rhea pennata]|uniref:von Willebrand factor C and EGF domain-containing protein isoform X2 n=1 Tax=Rhea pennata TaxID=8795 RepID=UPI002E26DAAB